MKKTLILSVALCAVFPMFADLSGDGYYRVQNLVTDRYVSVVDNRGRIDFVATTADLQAITLDKRFEVVSSDAASVLYIDKVGSQYNISSQGTSVHAIIDHYVTIEQNGSANGQKLYMCYGSYDGAVRYLGDGNNMGGNLGNMSTNTTGNYRKWYIKPVVADGDNYFGVEPDADATAGEYSGLYTTLYASFPCLPYSEGMKFYTVDIVDSGFVTLKEINGVVPAATPIIVKCVGETSSDNRLNVGGSGVAVDGNASLKGVYFNCSKDGHINRTAYNSATMRVLGVCQDGSLGFVQAPISYIPANTVYLTVPAGSPSEYKCVTEEEYKAGVDEVGIDAKPKTVYTVTGIKIGESMSSEEIKSLPSGMYIVGGKKVILR